MKKPAALRRYLLECIPWLKANPDQLQVYIDAGNIRTNLVSLNFQYNYTLQIFVTDFALHPDAVMVPILAWLRTHQTDFPDDGLTFEADILNDELVDLSITMPLDERVLVTESPFNTEHLEEPSLEHLLPEPPLLKTLFANTENLADSTENHG